MGTPTLRTKFTWSVWIKRSELGTYATLASMWKNGNEHFMLRFDDTDQLRFYYTDGSSLLQDLKTNALYRDISGWMNIVATFDSTENTASSRAKLYVNGEQITSFATSTYPSINAQPNANASGTDHYLGARGDGQNYGGLMSHCHFVDGAVYPASAFGSTDNVTGEWSINTAPTITEYGTNGWFMFKDDASLTDRSGKSNNFTNQSGTLTQTEDCPSNVFATLNPLLANTGATFSKGNTACYRTTSGNYRRIGCTLGATSGKYYAEFLLGASQWAGVCLTNGGDMQRTQRDISGYMGEYADDKSVGVRNDGIVYSSGANVSSAQWNQGSISTTDRLCLALDMDNKKLFLGKNGTWSSSSNPATNTGGITLTGDSYTFCVATSNADCMINAGNGYMGTTAISSEGTNASGIGKFEYDVPSQGSTIFTALSTKGLNL